jgi:hypothetical protein
LKIGDTIILYYDENEKSSNLYVNSLIQFIDKDKTPYFIRGNYLDKAVGYGGIILGVLIGLTLWWLLERDYIS